MPIQATPATIIPTTMSADMITPTATSMIIITGTAATTTAMTKGSKAVKHKGRPPILEIKPIGVIHNELVHGVSAPRARAARSVIEIDPDLADGLAGMSSGQSLVVVFAFHQSPPFSRERLLQHPQGDPARPARGVFTLRSPHRPNRIGLTTVRLLEVEGTRLIVSGLDAFDGTPVLDIKPHVAWLDEPQDMERKDSRETDSCAG